MNFQFSVKMVGQVSQFGPTQCTFRRVAKVVLLGPLVFLTGSPLNGLEKMAHASVLTPCNFSSLSQNGVYLTVIGHAIPWTLKIHSDTALYISLVFLYTKHTGRHQNDFNARAHRLALFPTVPLGLLGLGERPGWWPQGYTRLSP
jgi:hypothetical protein